jgi:ATP-dependent Lon protease
LDTEEDLSLNASETAAAMLGIAMAIAMVENRKMPIGVPESAKEQMIEASYGAAIKIMYQLLETDYEREAGVRKFEQELEMMRRKIGQ